MGKCESFFQNKAASCPTNRNFIKCSFFCHPMIPVLINDAIRLYTCGLYTFICINFCCYQMLIKLVIYKIRCMSSKERWELEGMNNFNILMKHAKHRICKEV